MKISDEYPPNYDDFLAFCLSLREYEPIFCYGETIYNPFKRVITADLIAHESVHSFQQKKDPQTWYMLYFKDPSFRLEQEVEAYRTQYQFMAKYIKDRNQLAFFRMQLASGLASPLYGSLVSQAEALVLIKGKARIKA